MVYVHMEALVLRYLSLWGSFFTNSITRDLEYKANFIGGLFVDIVYYGVQYFFFAIIYSYVESIGIFTREDVSFEIFQKLVKSGSKVRCISTKNTKDKPRSFFDNIDKWAKEQGASGLAYFTIEKDKKISGKGPIGKFFSEDSIKEIMKIFLAQKR